MRYYYAEEAAATAVFLILVISWRLPNKIYHVDTVQAGTIDCTGTVTPAVIGDYGDAGQPEEDVANLVHSWNVDYVLTVWLQTQMTSSSAPWNLVALHHAPYSSSASHGSNPFLQWPYADWGATAVLAGHDHTYERIHQDGILYFVNGLGGRSIYNFANPVPGSVVRYNLDYGAMRLEASPLCINFSFYSRAGSLIDSITRYKPDYFANHLYLPFTIK